MISGYWERALGAPHEVPDDRPLDELTAELTTMLGDSDPRVRTRVAVPVLLGWIAGGTYDELLRGLGDGMAEGLSAGLGDDGSPSVHRRSSSALVLAACVDRDTERALVPGDAVLSWGDRVMTWLLREQDLRGHVPGEGLAHALAHGADALAALARSPHLQQMELTVVLDVVADRLLAPTHHPLVAGEPDRLAAATMAVLRRDLVGLEVLEPWVARLAAGALPDDGPDDDPDAGGSSRDPWLVTGTVQAYLRALHLQLALAADPPPVRSDLLLVLIAALRATNATVLGLPRTTSSATAPEDVTHR